MGTHIELPLLFSKAKAQEKGDALILDIIVLHGSTSYSLPYGFESLTDRKKTWEKNKCDTFRNIAVLLILRILQIKVSVYPISCALW